MITDSIGITVGVAVEEGIGVATGSSGDGGAPGADGFIGFPGGENLVTNGDFQYGGTTTADAGAYMYG